MLSTRYLYDNKPALKLNKFQFLIRDQINHNIFTNIYNFEEVQCPICDQNNFNTIAQKDRYGIYFTVVICKDCGLILTNPRMDQSSYNDFYKSYYRKLYIGKKEPTEAFFQNQVERGKRIAKLLSDVLKFPIKNKRIIEVGCGAGGILKYFKDLGNDVFGCDLDIDYLEYGQSKYNLNINYGTIENLNLNNPPEVIIYSHVLEHVLDINKELTLIHNLLDENGIIYIEVPSIKYMRNHLGYKADFLKYLQNAHTYHFTLTSLENLLCKNGFKLLYGNEAILSVFSKESNNQFIKKNDYQSVMCYLKSAESYRRYFWLDPKNIKKLVRTKIIKFLDMLHLKNPIRRLLKRRD